MDMNWDYIAGFFDGEGAVIIYEDPRRVGLQSTTVRLQIGQTNKAQHLAICRFLENEGISYTTYEDIKRLLKGHSICYYIKIGRAHYIRKFIQNIIGISITKHDKLLEAKDALYRYVRA